MKKRGYSNQPMNVGVRGRGLKSKLVILSWFLAIIILFSLSMDYLINGYGVQYDGKLPDIYYYLINPVKAFLGQFGEITVTDAWILYAIGMFAMAILLFFGFYLFTGNPRFLILGLAILFLAVPFEDYFAHVFAGNFWPTWEGPVKGFGFTLGIPNFYFIFFIPGFSLLFVWLFWEHRYHRLYKSIDKIQHVRISSSIFGLNKNKRRRIR